MIRRGSSRRSSDGGRSHPSYPSDPEELRRALELEEYFDESCGHDLRRVLFNDSLAEPEKFLGMFYGPDNPRLGLLKALSPDSHPS